MTLGAQVGYGKRKNPICFEFQCQRLGLSKTAFPNHVNTVIKGKVLKFIAQIHVCLKVF